MKDIMEIVNNLSIIPSSYSIWLISGKDSIYSPGSSQMTENLFPTVQKGGNALYQHSVLQSGCSWLENRDIHYQATFIIDPRPSRTFLIGLLLDQSGW
jgi:hypothetical protein